MFRFLRNKMKKKKFSFTEGQIKLLEDLKNTHNFTSESDIMRHALLLLHKRQFPYYKVKDEAKDEDWQAREELKKLPLEQYVAQILQGDIQTKPGFCVLRHKNDLDVSVDIPVNLVKNYASRNEVWASMKDMPLEEEE